MKLALIYPLIVACGIMQAWGPPMNGALQKSLGNPWLASVVSFLPVVAFLLVLMLCMPRPLPTADGLASMPWWAPLGGLAGSFAVVAGLIFVGKIGAGPYAALTIGANLLMSIVVDGFALFGMQHHAITLARVAGAVLMMGGMALITAF
jgi:bacterial/archaeal transporter family-2 protein